MADTLADLPWGREDTGKTPPAEEERPEQTTKDSANTTPPAADRRRVAPRAEIEGGRYGILHIEIDRTRAIASLAWSSVHILNERAEGGSIEAVNDRGKKPIFVASLTAEAVRTFFDAAKDPLLTIATTSHRKAVPLVLG